MEHGLDGPAIGVDLNHLMRFEVDIRDKIQPLLGHAALFVFNVYPDGTNQAAVQEPCLGDNAPIPRTHWSLP
jgi:hypothetical protein